MKAALIFGLFLCVLVSCSAGPVFIAKNDADGIKTSYEDPALSELAARYRPALTEIYNRYKSAGIDVYPNGIGFTTLIDDSGRKLHYLLVQVRPRDITFGMGETKPKERFAEVYEHHFEKDLRHLTAADVQKDGIDGVAFGVYWPVRDFSQCHENGGFIEYTIVYFHKNDFLDLAENRETLSNVIDNTEVVTSLDGKPAKAVRVTEVE